MDGSDLPSIDRPPPGPESSRWVERLAETECPAITARRARRAGETGVDQDPIVWEEAIGANVRDVDGNVYVDLTAAFAVGGIGHRHPDVVAAAKGQLDTLIHAMGDVYPGRTKIEFCERLADVAPGRLRQSILGLNGSDAIGAALKTAVMHTGKPGVIAFWGGYHGLNHGALAVTGYRKSFREPFAAQLNQHVTHVPYPDPFRPPFGLRDAASPGEVRDAVLAHLREMLDHPGAGADSVGAVVVEPILGRGGEVVPPDGFLAGLRDICDEFELVLIFDEIFTGFGRTGEMFACEHEGIVPDILCVGKSMGGGFPLSAAIGTPEVMESWGLSSGESLHTATFLGNPLGCAMGLAVLDVLESDDWPRRVAEKGRRWRSELVDLQSRHPDVIGDVRGRGLMIGVDLVEPGTARAPDRELALRLVDSCRREGFLVLGSGSRGNVLGLSPPFVTTDEQFAAFLDVLEKGIEKAGGAR